MASTSQGDIRRYGQACVACRKKKRKCLPSDSGGDRCMLCERDGDECQVSSKRRRTSSRVECPTGQTQTSDAGPGDHISQRISFSSPAAPLVRPSGFEPDTMALQSLSEASTIHDSYTHYTSSPWAGPSTASTEDGPTPRAMRTGPRTPYHLAVADFVDRVCGPPGQDEPQETLLKTYFAWQCPQHMPVNEKLFRRDMQASPHGPYYSPLLLQALHAQASRHLAVREEGWTYGDRANALLIPTLTSLPSLTTIQALLILAGRDLALNMSSPGWLKSGMAFRMIEDLGLAEDAMIDMAQVPEHRREEVEMRKRVFWSAYSWDKFFALTMGRRPTFRLPAANIQVYRSNANSPWEPFSPEGAFGTYPMHMDHAGETFHALCLLQIELEAIIDRLYIGVVPATTEGPPIIDDLRARLLQWRQKVAGILLDTSYLPPFCPPPHIFTLNLLYRTAWILLQRPLIRYETHAMEARRACVARSAELHSLFELHERTFNLRNITYLVAYVAYVSATVDVVEALSNDVSRSGPAAQRLELTLRVLTRAAGHTPGILRSIHHLRHKLRQPRSGRAMPGTSGTITPTTAHPSGSAIDADGLHSAILADASREPIMDGTVIARDRSGSAGEDGTIHWNMHSNVFGDVPLGWSFEELFAALQPEGSVQQESYVDAVADSTACLPLTDYDWLNL